jgi:hypothetical protein
MEGEEKKSPPFTVCISLPPVERLPPLYMTDSACEQKPPCGTAPPTPKSR